MAVFGPWGSYDNRLKGLEDWKKEIEPWGGRVKTLENWKMKSEPWKNSTDNHLKNLEGSHQESLNWQANVENWRKTTTDSRLGKLDEVKLGVDEYRKEQYQRDKQIVDLQGVLSSAIPEVRKRIETVEGKVAGLGEKVNEIDEAIEKLKKKTKRHYPSSRLGTWIGSGEGDVRGVAINGEDSHGNIYMIQQQGQQPFYLRSCR
ncbi:hypothetical protein N431DRAFT_473987 [Stipitochalara longipes BDJ]|nr:hypothetical protein N431DRAFT_473987 [Stipitochalara longipes BDJ]